MFLYRHGSWYMRACADHTGWPRSLQIDENVAVCSHQMSTGPGAAGRAGLGNWRRGHASTRLEAEYADWLGTTQTGT